MPSSPRSPVPPDGRPDSGRDADAPGRKLGLALSGGGFRASLYHLGVLRRLAELDLLRRVEVVSTVSGGSIVGALYALLVKRELERSERLGRRDYLELVDELTRRTKEGIRSNPRARLLLDPVAVARALATSRGLARRMARLYERHFFAPVADELEGVEAPDGRVALSDLRVRPGGRPLEGGIESHNRARLREIRRGEPAAVVPQLVVNATSLNSGERFRFTAVEVGDRHLGHVRRDESGELLDRKRLLEDRVDGLTWPGGTPAAVTLDGLLRKLRSPYGDVPAVEIRGSASARRTAELARWWREGEHDRVPPGWEELGGRLAHLPGCLARAEMGLLREAKLAAWHLRVGRTGDGSGRAREGGVGAGTTGGRSPREHWTRLHASLEEIDPRLHRRAVARWETSGTDRAGRRTRGRLLLDFVLETYWIRSAERVSRRLEDDWRRLTLGQAVAASAAFPPVFAPMRLPGIWDGDHLPRLTLTDGGVFDNMGIVALLEEECDCIVASDAGARFRRRGEGPTNRLTGAARSLGVLRKAVAGSQRQRMRERRRISRSLEELLSAPPRSEPVERGLRQALARRRLSGLAYFHIGSPRERPEARAGPSSREAAATGDAGSGAPHPAPHMGLDTDLLAGVRTDLDAFGEVEAAALIDRGYETADQYVRSFLRDTLGSAAWKAEDRRPSLPEPLPSRKRVHRVLRAGSARFLRPLRLLRLERPGAFRTAAGATGLTLAAAGALAAARAGWSLQGAVEVAADALLWVAVAAVALLVAAGALGVAAGILGLVSGRVHRRMTRVGATSGRPSPSAQDPRREDSSGAGREG